MRRICQQVIYPLKDIYPQSGITVVLCKLLQQNTLLSKCWGVSHDVGFLFQDQWMMSELFSFWSWQEWSVHFHLKWAFSILNTCSDMKRFGIETPDDPEWKLCVAVQSAEEDRWAGWRSGLELVGEIPQKTKKLLFSGHILKIVSCSRWRNLNDILWIVAIYQDEIVKFAQMFP